MNSSRAAVTCGTSNASSVKPVSAPSANATIFTGMLMLITDIAAWMPSSIVCRLRRMCLRSPIPYTTVDRPTARYGAIGRDDGQGSVGPRGWRRALRPRGPSASLRRGFPLRHLAPPRLLCGSEPNVHASGVPSDVQGVGSPELPSADHDPTVVVEPKVRQPLEQAGQRGLRLETTEPGAQAEVVAGRERQVGALLPMDVEPPGSVNGVRRGSRWTDRGDQFSRREGRRRRASSAAWSVGWRSRPERSSASSPRSPASAAGRDPPGPRAAARDA